MFIPEARDEGVCVCVGGVTRHYYNYHISLRTHTSSKFPYHTHYKSPFTAFNQIGATRIIPLIISDNILSTDIIPLISFLILRPNINIERRPTSH